MAKKKKYGGFLQVICEDFKKMILGNIVLDVLFLVFGIIIYLNPAVTQRVTEIILGVYLIIFGVMDILEFLGRIKNPIFSYRLFIGIIAGVLGIFIILNPFKISNILTFVLGIYLAVGAVFKVLEALKFKKYGYDGWLLVFVISVLLFIFGVLIAINPMRALYIVEAAALFIILSSILEMCNLIMMFSKAKEISKLFK